MTGPMIGWLLRTYSGQTRLWRVFWLGWVPPAILINITFELIRGQRVAVFAFVFVVSVYQFWAAVALWRCAPNASHRAYTFLGRSVSVLQWIALFGVISNLNVF
jgi:hypothetical protein